jgi:hypothetical protein
MIAICIPLFSVFGFHGIIDKSNSQQQIQDVFDITLSSSDVKNMVRSGKLHEGG